MTEDRRQKTEDVIRYQKIVNRGPFVPSVFDSRITAYDQYSITPTLHCSTPLGT
jgi:hypothetical protein